MMKRIFIESSFPLSNALSERFTAHSSATIVLDPLQADVIIISLVDEELSKAGEILVRVQADEFSKKERTLIGISQVVQTWGAMQNNISSSSWKMRAPLRGFVEAYRAENAVLRANSPLLRTFVVGAGILYGCGESSNFLSRYFDEGFKLWVSGKFSDPLRVPFYGNQNCGDNVLPTIHMLDLASIVTALAFSSKVERVGGSYVVAVDKSTDSAAEIFAVLEDLFGKDGKPLRVTGGTEKDAETKSFSERDYSHYVTLAANMKMTAYDIPTLKEPWIAHDGLCKCSKSMLMDSVSSWMSKVRVEPLHVAISTVSPGTDHAEQNSVAKVVADFLSIPLISVEVIVTKLKDDYVKAKESSGDDAFDEKMKATDALLTLGKKLSQFNSVYRIPIQLLGNAVVAGVGPLLDEKMKKRAAYTGFVVTGLPLTALRELRERLKLNTFICIDKEEEEEGTASEMKESKGLSKLESKTKGREESKLKSREETKAKSMNDNIAEKKQNNDNTADDVKSSDLLDELVRELANDLIVLKGYTSATANSTIVAHIQAKYNSLTPERFRQALPLQNEVTRVEEEVVNREEKTEEVAEKTAVELAKGAASTALVSTFDFESCGERSFGVVESKGGISEEDIRAEKKELEKRCKPLRELLIKEVVPSVSAGLIALCNARPDNPLEFLGNFLTKYKNEIK
eukprot:g5144.t1